MPERRLIPACYPVDYHKGLLASGQSGNAPEHHLHTGIVRVTGSGAYRKARHTSGDELQRRCHGPLDEITAFDRCHR